jgi:A/G-specific adenine glycosylase
MPGARIVIPDVEVELDETDVNFLVAELRLTDNPEGPGDAAGAADKLERAGVAPIAFDHGEAAAVFKALTNLRSAGALRPGEMTRLRDLLVGTTGIQPVETSSSSSASKAASTRGAGRATRDRSGAATGSASVTARSASLKCKNAAARRSAWYVSRMTTTGRRTVPSRPPAASPETSCVVTGVLAPCSHDELAGSGEPSTLSPVKELLLAWYQENRRPLPWRETTDPYAILVSEVMLQQTQVERVVPRWRAWLERWPTAAALAAASPADVIREWQGLGYNRRAVNLHRAAQYVAAHGWPDDLTELPGVGRYTADAVASFAFGRPVLPVDTNVRRIQERTGHAFGAECGQALMDLGATTCLARIPRCGSCPLSDACPSYGRRYEPLRKQSPFEGSFRQRRARTLRRVASGAVPLAELDAEAVHALARDGLVAVTGDLVALPA